MILRNVRLEGLGCFADGFTAGPFAPGVNVVFAPNGSGKTTLARGVSLGFLEPHRAKAAEIQALRPWGRRLTPQVSIEFEHSGRVYRTHKRFLDASSAGVEMKEGDNWTAFAKGDDADEFLREVLKTDADRPRASKRDSWGLAQVLWTTQGDLSLPPFSPNVIESVRGSIGAQLTAGGSAIREAIEAEFRKFFTPEFGKLKTGRNGAPLVRMEAERERLSAELQTMEELLNQFEDESRRIEELRAKSEAAGARRSALQQELEKVQTSVIAYDQLMTEQKVQHARRNAANSAQKQIRDRIEHMASLRRQVQALENSLASLTAEIPGLAKVAGDMREKAEQADLGLESAARCERQARETVARAQLARDYTAALEQSDRIARQLAAVELKRAEIRAAGQQISAIIAPTGAQIRELRSVIDRESDAVRRLEMARITVGFTPETPIEIEVIVGEQPGKITCAAQTPVRLAGAPALTFQITGVGRFEASGPVSDFETVRKLLDRERAWLVTFKRQFGSADPDALDALRQRVTTLEASIKEVNRAINALLGDDTEAGLLEAGARFVARTQAIEQDHPAWSASAPDADGLRTTANADLDRAVRERDSAAAEMKCARASAVEAGAARDRATGRQTALLANLESDRSLLVGSLADGLTDEQRYGRLDEAVLEFDTCRIALASVEAKLAPFTVDPRLEGERLAGDIARLEQEAKQSKEELVRAETRIQSLVERRPYGACAELSERLAALNGQLERERLRMNALALLRKTLEDTEAEMMTAVASPIERIASDYLEEICGCSIADVRLTQELAAEQVIPAALSEDSDGRVELDRLSGGEQEQVLLCTRLAIGSELARRERQTVVLDDVLAFTDDDRIARVCELLTRLSDRLQIILLTCHPERFASLRGANRIDLARNETRLAAAGRH